MFVPAQGFRHAATLFLTNSARAIPADASPEETRHALERLAHGLVSLADDMRVSADASEWVVAEFNTTIDRLPQSLDREAAKSAGAAMLARIGTRARQVSPARSVSHLRASGSTAACGAPGRRTGEAARLSCVRRLRSGHRQPSSRPQWRTASRTTAAASCSGQGLRARAHAAPPKTIASACSGRSTSLRPSPISQRGPE